MSAIAALVHELQKERGVWNIHLASGGRRFSEQIAPKTAPCQKYDQERRTRFHDLDRMVHGAARTRTLRGDVQGLIETVRAASVLGPAPC